MAFAILSIQTLVFWSIVVVLHKLKSRYTLVPLYSYLAVLTVLTHNLSDFGFAIIRGQWFFLIASVSFFTTLMFIVLFVYLFEGPRAARVAIWVILGSSLFYILVVYLLHFQTDTSHWVQLTLTTARTYFWSIFAILVDVFLLAIFWELLSKIKSIPLVVRVFLITFSVLAIDSLIFTTGVFLANDFFVSILRGNLIIRLALSLLAAPVITLLLKSEGFVEEKRIKPRNFWEILNFRSDLEIKIISLEDTIKENTILADQLKAAKETYELVIAGSGAGIWDWNVVTSQITSSQKVYDMLGYKRGELKGTLDGFKELLHSDDVEKTFKVINESFVSGKRYEVECRLKTKSGDYHWFVANGITKCDDSHKPLRMVGSIIDINAKKQAENTIQKTLNELKELNAAMVGRELKMVELKKKIAGLENP